MDDRMIFFLIWTWIPECYMMQYYFPRIVWAAFLWFSKTLLYPRALIIWSHFRKSSLIFFFSSSEVLSSVLKELFNCNYYIFSSPTNTSNVFIAWLTTHTPNKTTPFYFLNTNLPRSYNHQVWMNWDLTCI